MTGDAATPSRRSTDPQGAEVSSEDLLGFLQDFRAPAKSAGGGETDVPGQQPSQDPRPADQATWLDEWAPAPPTVAPHPVTAAGAPAPAPEWAPPGPEWAPPPGGSTRPGAGPPSYESALPPSWPPPDGAATPGWPPGPPWPPAAPPWGTAGSALPPPGQNSGASVSLGLGIGSILVPLLSIPGLILGVRSLRRSRRYPWVGGRGRSIGGIVTSVVLGPAMAVIVGIAVFNALHRENMSRVRSAISATVQTQMQAATGASADLRVQCPASEPRKPGTTFTCVVTDLDNGRSIDVQVRETDSNGDFVMLPAGQDAA